MSRPKLLDLFSGAGGAARGYQMAGFHVTGVDVELQPRYAGDEFIKADALDFPLDGYAAVHASPPCQRYSRMQRAAGNAAAHPDLVPATRARLRGAGVPWVIENVTGAPMPDAVTLCGASFGLEVVRHRLFETSMPLLVPPCGHVTGGTTTGLYVAFRHSGRVAPGRTVPPRRTEGEFRRAIGCGWMTLKEAREAIPPAYTAWLGAALLAHLAHQEAAR